MPVQECQEDNLPGFRWGDAGKCYTYQPGNEQSRERAREEAEAQGRAINARRGGADMDTEGFQEESAAPTYAMVALIPTAEQATALAIPSEGAEPPEQLHVTLVYLGPEATLNLDRTVVEAVVADVASRHPAITGTFNGTGHFGPEAAGRTADEEGQIPVVTTLDAVGLGALREDLVATLRQHVEYPPDTHGFCPHMTLAYWPPGTDDHEQLPEPSMLEVTFESVAVCWGDYLADPANWTEIPLGGATLLTPVDLAPEVGMARRPGTLSMGTADLPDGLRRQLQEAPPPALSTEPQWKSVIVREGKPTNDRRNIEPGVLRAMQQDVLPGMWTDKTTENHKDALRALNITRLWKDGNAWRGEGVYADTEAGRELQRQTEAGTPYWPSVDIGDAVSIYEVGEDGLERELLIGGVVVGFTLVSMQAQEGTWFLPIGAEEPAEPAAAPEPEPIVAAAAPLHPPAAWFAIPDRVDDETPLTVTEDGQVYGHIAGGGCHVGLPGCVRVPTDVDYGMFNDSRGSIRTAEGADIRVGPITLVGGHAPIRNPRGPIGYQASAQHYDNTESSVAYGRVGPTRVGNRVLPWFSGVLRPTATEEQIHTLRAHGVSGDWRPHDGRTTLTAVLSVPVPGLPIRPKALVAGGQIEALITSSPQPQPDFALAPRDEEDDMDPQALEELHRRWHETVQDPGSKAELAEKPPEGPDGEPLEPGTEEPEEKEGKEEETEEQRFARFHAQAHAPAPADGKGEGETKASMQEALPDAPAEAAPAAVSAEEVFAAFQAGVQSLIDYMCETAGSMTECMEIIASSAPDIQEPGALCNWMREQCGGEFGIKQPAGEPEMTPEMLVASLAADTVKERFHGMYAGDVASLREKVAAGGTD